MPQSSNVLHPGDESEGEAVRAHRQAMEELNPRTSSVKAAGRPVNPSPKDRINPKGAPYGDRPGEKRIDVTEALRPLGSFKTGTPYVPKTGVYQLHEGEAVVPKEKNTMNVTDAMAGITGKAKPPKEIKAMTHTKTHNGKHIVTHHHHHPEHHPDETHAFDNMADLHSHMEDHAGVPNEGEEAPSGASAPAPLTAAPSSMPAPATPGM